MGYGGNVGVKGGGIGGAVGGEVGAWQARNAGVVDEDCLGVS